MMFTLVRPSIDHLWGFEDALRRGWSPDNTRGDEAIEQGLREIGEDPARFIALQEDREALGGPITLPDGSQAPRLPGFRRWMWDGEFCGTVGVRWTPGTTDLPPHCLGHVGYAVAPWKRRRGYATRALALLLPELADLRLPFIELTTDAANLPSQRVILANSGVLIGSFIKPQAYGGGEGLRFRIALPATGS